MVPYRVRARTTAPDSDNKIHDDEVARRYGFSGGLVPGVVVHAYLCHPPAEQWGLDWVGGGTIRARFHRPVYDGGEVVIEPDGGIEGEDRHRLVARTAAAEEAATAEVGPPDPRGAAAVASSVDLSRWEHRPAPAKAARPAASEAAFAARPLLGALDCHFRSDLADRYLDAIGEALPLYREEGVAHPGWLSAQANYVLAANVVLGPWIHVESEVRHLGLVHDGDLVSTRAVVVGTSQRGGHRFVELDVLIVNGTERPVARARHVAIYEPREPD